MKRYGNWFAPLKRGRQRCALRLRPNAARALRSALRRMEGMSCAGYEPLRRMKADAGRIGGCLRRAEKGGYAFLPSRDGEARMVKLARSLLAGGEKRVDRDEMERCFADADSVHGLEMLEAESAPDAMNLVLSMEFLKLAREVLHCAGMRRRAEDWLQSGARRRPAQCGDEFLVHALHLSAEAENPELHARTEQMIERCGLRRDEMVEAVHRRAANCCLRLENLLHALHLLEETDWEKCFERISGTETELRGDPAGIYAAMDAPSRSAVRSDAAQMAAALGVPEMNLVRYALRAAGAACREYGREDARASVCFYFSEDAGRAALCRELGLRRRLRRKVPDAGGGKTAALLAGLSVLLCALMCLVAGKLLLTPLMPPLAWALAMQIAAWIHPRCIRPARLLKLRLDAVPDDARTLVTLPVLISSAARAREMVNRLEALGCLERDANIDFLLLGDFRDADEAELSEDGEILEILRRGVDELNRNADRPKYYYLHRARSYRERDGRWMGENRKRGALMALNALLLNRAAAEQAFGAEGRAAGALAGRYAYVLTLDADTEYLPGTVQKLVGAMLHPLNRKYAVLQPCMQFAADAAVNAYGEYTAPEGGVDGYPVSVSDLWQDATGRGCFAGKGIYDVRAFDAATMDRLPDDAILSHDLIEGILAGTGFVNDVCFYEGMPENLRAGLLRLNRWTRGDWQLLPVLGMAGIAPGDRLKMIGNLLRSLYAPALTALLILSVWLDAPEGFALGLFMAFREPIARFAGKREWRRALFRLSVLPAEAACTLDAVLRTLWRLAVSRRHLMDWVPAADSAGIGGDTRLPGRIAALLLLPGLLVPFWIPAAAGMAALFLVGGGWADDLARKTREAAPLSGEQQDFLWDLARRSWHFFEEYVPEDGCGLPPDNVQLDPDVGAAMRTSPTNIGFYLMCCLCAGEMDLIREETMLRRMQRCISTMEKLEKWQGQLYNWYDTRNLAPLQPRYVSSVDSGNLAGALLLCAHALRKRDAELARRMRMLAENMNLAAVYDAQRKLFFIGMDVQSGRMSQAHYDLYASESRILSYAAIMLGQVPPEHWKHLSRACVRAGRRLVPLSWSGTMFEYLMPELLIPGCPGTLAGEMCCGALDQQMAFGRALNRPWGVSESGHYAFDQQLNYQYRAFGLRALALNGSAVQDVAAPYAAALALAVDPCAAADNLRRMCEMGWCGEFGMYEAADYMHLDAGHQPRIVRSHMAHHQGMILCALCNALRNRALSRCFMEIPQARALRLLLQEKPLKRPRMRRREAPTQMFDARERPQTGYMRTAVPGKRTADVQLIHGAGTTALVTDRGGVFAWKNGVMLNRFSGDLTDAREGMYVHICDMKTGREQVIGREGRVCFDAGSACFTNSDGGLRTRMTVTVSPEDGALYQQLEIENADAQARTLEISGCMAAAMLPEREMRDHPVFQNLFVECLRRNERTLVLRRRLRRPGKALPVLVYTVCGGEGVEAEGSLEKLVGRWGALGLPGGISRNFSGSTGHVLNPCAALRVRMKLNAGETRRMHFALQYAEERDVDTAVERCAAPGAPERALQLCTTQTRALLEHAGIDGRHFHLLQRSCAFLLDPGLRRWTGSENAVCPPVERSLLWELGISGDLPIILAETDGKDGLDCVRECIRMHGFFRLMGLKTDLVVVNRHGCDYMQPTRGALEDLIASGHLSDGRGVPGGVYLLEKQNLKPEHEHVLARMAHMRFGDDADFMIRLRQMLDGLLVRDACIHAVMAPGRVDFPRRLRCFNGYGGFDGAHYAILLKNGMMPPAPWSNVLSSEQAGAIVTERGGGYAWYGNSRSGRLTSFRNDALCEGWGWMFYLLEEDAGWMRLMPGERPMGDFCVLHGPGETIWRAAAGEIAFEVEMRAEACGLQFEITLKNDGKRTRHLRLIGFVDWLMGTHGCDAAALRSWSRFGACFASGLMPGVGCFAADDPRARTGCDRLRFLNGGDLMQPRGLDALDEAGGGCTLHLPLSLRPGEMRKTRFLLGWAADADAAHNLARDFRSGEALRRSREDWQDRLDKLKIETPDAAVNLLANGFLQAQILNSRIRGRAGLYQPGGAFGFRDQLQDMLPMIHYEPERVRRHLLYCAARQFEAGDVLHWWHEPFAGVRTGISDDLLFLPWVAAQYAVITGDCAVLNESVPFLRDIEIPEGHEDIYAQMQPSENRATLHEHCMRAIRRACATGRNGLCLMGAGDWNDGMNRVGSEGRGESIWLTEFLAACADAYAEVAPEADDRIWLKALSGRMRDALEARGWDGEWYLRAYADNGEKLGSRENKCCRIDAISQAWAVTAGLDRARSAQAMDSAWKQLADGEAGIIKLLAPPFDGSDLDPGYIAAYPPGVRENGAQYTHAACWMLCALAEMGDADRAHRALQMLLPVNHALSREEAENYRVEPYVMAADIYAGEYAGRGGWTWYTGSAAWMLTGILKILGYERRGNRVRLRALLGNWPQASLELRWGQSRYRLECRADTMNVSLDGAQIPDGWILLTDDGRSHCAQFPPRRM